MLYINEFYSDKESQAFTRSFLHLRKHEVTAAKNMRQKHSTRQPSLWQFAWEEEFFSRLHEITSSQSCFGVNLGAQIRTIMPKMPFRVANETELLLFLIQPWNDGRPHHNNIKAPLLSVKSNAMMCWTEFPSVGIISW